MITNILQPPVPISQLITNPPPVTGQTGSQIVDFPYIYVFDGTSLTNATSPTGLNVTITADADFYLRRIFGVPFVASKMQFRQPFGKRYQSDLMVFPTDYALPLEIKFEAQTSIRFDLGTVLKFTNGTVPLAFIGFQGAKRSMLSAIPYDTPYPFKRLGVSHNYALSLNWRYADTPNLRMQTLLLNNYDFELHAIEIVNVPAFGTFPFAIQLFDAYGNQTSNLPVNAQWVNARQNGIAGPAPFAGTLMPLFPVPPLLYPRNSMIRFDIQSLLAAGDDTQNYTILFHGFDRYPLGV